jgi:DNA-binding NtrC family response regulator
MTTMTPMAPAREAAPATASRPLTQPDTLRVLVADDQPDIIEAVRMLLESEGLVVVSATSPGQAVEAARTHLVHAALVDLNYEQGRTSGEQGLDLVARLHQVDPAMPIIVMTAWSSIGLALEAMRRGAKDFIEKPFDETRLVSTLRSQAELCSARRRIAELEAQLAAMQAGAAHSQSTYEAMRLREVEGQLVRNAMLKARGNVSRAARALGLSRSALYRRLERHHLSTSGEPVS